MEGFVNHLPEVSRSFQKFSCQLHQTGESFSLKVKKVPFEIPHHGMPLLCVPESRRWWTSFSSMSGFSNPSCTAKLTDVCPCVCVSVCLCVCAYVFCVRLCMCLCCVCVCVCVCVSFVIILEMQSFNFVLFSTRSSPRSWTYQKR